MPSNDALEQLASVALLGTERAADLASLSEGHCKAFASQMAARPPEQILLGIAAIESVRAKAGVLPKSIAIGRSPSPPDGTTEISANASRYLTMILSDHHADVLPELLSKIAHVHERIAPRHIPALLNLAAREETVLPLVASVIGTRGHWLANQKAEWKKLFNPPSEEHFDTGTPKERLAALKQLRNIDPDRARTLVESSWPTEKPDDRVAFLALFSHRLSIADEPFLEAALDDKRKEVRERAADLLSRLPDSRLSLRMIERLNPLVTLSKTLLRRTKVTFNVPAAHTPDMARDGIDAKSPIRGLGDLGSHLALIIASTPLPFWQQFTSFEPAALLKQVDDSEWSDAVMWGFTTATIRQQERSFAIACINHWASASDEQKTKHPPRTLELLLSILPPEERESVLVPMLGNRAFYDYPGLHELFLACRHPWGAGFSTQCIPLLWHYVEDNHHKYTSANAVANIFGLYAHPQILTPLSEKLREDDALKSNALDKFLSLLQFRSDIQKEFAR